MQHVWLIPLTRSLSVPGEIQPWLLNGSATYYLIAKSLPAAFLPVKEPRLAVRP